MTAEDQRGSGDEMVTQCYIYGADHTVYLHAADGFPQGCVIAFVVSWGGGIRQSFGVDFYMLEVDPENADGHRPSPFETQAMPSGALLVQASEGHFTKIYAPGAWSEMSTMPDEWTRSTSDWKTD